MKPCPDDGKTTGGERIHTGKTAEEDFLFHCKVSIVGSQSTEVIEIEPTQEGNKTGSNQSLYSFFSLS